MRHRTFHRRIAWRIVVLGTIWLSIIVFILASGSGVCRAQPYDPMVPMPPLWCPGNGPGVSSSSFGAYCEGQSFPDGTRWNAYRIGYFWQPMRCILPDGSPTPPLAPEGCGAVQ